MDFALVHRLAEGFRQMPADELASRFAEKDVLAPEARQALFEVVAAHPKGDWIRERAAAQVRPNRPSSGIALGFLTFQLCAGILINTYNTWSYIDGWESGTPQLSGVAAWLTYKWIRWGICAVDIVAASVALHAIYFGRSRRAVFRVIGCLWFMPIGSSAIDALAVGTLFDWEFVRAAYLTKESVREFVITVIICFLWSLYLLRSKRCQQRYPRTEISVAQAKGT
jgi:hypothetical protein